MKKRIFMYFSVCLIVLSMFSFSIKEASAAAYRVDFYMYEGNSSISPPSLTLPDNGQKMYIAFNITGTSWNDVRYQVFRNGSKIRDLTIVDGGGSASWNFSTPGTYSVKAYCYGTKKECKGQGYLLRQ